MPFSRHTLEFREEGELDARLVDAVIEEIEAGLDAIISRIEQKYPALRGKWND
jgi:hypothetical protein